MINAYLVDDEEHALNILDILLKETGGVTVVGSSANPFEALQQIIGLEPDVVFLDIEMPGMYGIELAERIQSELSHTEIVFVTAHDEYAVAAFKKEALDYLLKPLEEERLALTVQRISRRVAVNELLKPREALVEPRLQVKLLGSFVVYNERKEQLEWEWRTVKTKELFAFLLLHSKEGAHRDIIIDALWQEEDYSKSKIYLHTCLSYLRKTLQKNGFDSMIQYKDEKYYFRLDRVDCDYFALQSSLSASVHNLADSEDAGRLEAALELYRGPLLLHCDYVWAQAEIEHAHKRWTEARLHLAEYAARQGEWRKAIELAEQLLEHRPYDEALYLLLVDCYRSIGKHGEASKVQEKLNHALRELQAGLAKDKL